MKVRLLHWGRSWEHLSHGNQRQLEYHPYCQLELCVRGKILMRTAEQLFVLHRGDMLLIPRGVGHMVSYPDGDNEFYSLKFEVDPTPVGARFAGQCKFSSWCIKSLSGCHLPSARYALPIDSETREIVEGILSLTVKHFMNQDTAVEPEEPELFRKIRQIVLGGTGCTSVDEIARQMDMNTAQLNYLFSKTVQHSGGKNQALSVKKLIDNALLYQINRYLDFTDFSLSQIAMLLNFNNVYAFSRFYKRLTGVPPGQRRKK
ncbi:MAG: helix-turn-helix domain-containing protein [Lentisphaerae bacterium]|nr:helix-turn-helix domain-containing protein [Lentisphaerota bacterium]